MKNLYMLLIFMLALLINYQNAAGESWEKTNGPYGGNVYYIGPQNPGALLAGTENGIYKSTDDGSSWFPYALDGITVYDICRDSEGRYFANGPSGTYRSENNGITWELVSQGFYTDGKQIAVNSKDYIFAMGRMGHTMEAINRSTDHGSTWERRENGFLLMLSFVMMDNDDIFAGTYKEGVFKTTDDGNQWTKAGLDTFSVRYITKDGSGNIYAGTMNQGFYISTDSGATWVNKGLEEYDILTVYVDNGGTIWAGTVYNKIFKSTDMGDTWESSGQGLNNPMIHCIYKSNMGYIYTGTNYGGVYISNNDGSTWKESTEGIRNMAVSSMLINGDGQLFAATNGNGIFTSIDKGNNWAKANTGLNLFILKLAMNIDGSIFAATSNDGIYRSNDNGATWTKVKSCNSNQIRDIICGDDGNIYAGITNEGVYKSDDNGDTWENIGLSDNIVINALAVNEDGYIYAGTYTKGMKRSTDQGTTWEGLDYPVETVKSLLAASDGNIYAGDQDGHIYRSTDGGTSWVQTSNFLFDVNALFQRNGIVYAGIRDKGVYKSLDYGTHWEQIINGMGEITVNSLAGATDGTLYAGTGKGVYTTALKEETLDVPVLESPLSSSKSIDKFPILQWKSARGAEKYEIMIARDEEFYDDVIHEPDVFGISYRPQILDYYTTYYWRVRSVKQDTASAWSEVWNFTTKIEAPELLSPENNSANIRLTAELLWKEVDNATGYMIQVSRTEDFPVTETVYSGPAQNSSSHTITLQANKKYYWRVMAKTDDSESNWSPVWNFTTSISAPMLVYPDNGAEGLGTDVEFRWEPYEGFTNYTLEVATDDQFANKVFSEWRIYKEKYSLDNLEFNTRYYWRVRVRVGDNVSLWSETRTFKTGLAKPVLLLPEDKSVGHPLVVTLTWKEFTGAVSYILETAHSEDFSKVLMQNDTITQTQFELTGLENGQEYYWRVRAITEDSESPWSDARSFKTISDDPDLEAPVLFWPPNDTTGMNISVECKWHPSTGAKAYTLQIATDPKLTELILEEESISETISQATNLGYSTTYYWRVKARNDTKESPWSKIFSFTTVEEPESVEGLNIPGVFECTASPNPFDIYTNFNIDLEKASEITLDIYDVTGRHIANIFDGRLHQGNYSFRWEPENITKGWYIFVMEVNGKVFSGSIIHR